MQCPTDGTTLTMSERSGIEIDYCPTCRGVWLDRGELDKIIDRSLTQAAPAPAARRLRRTSTRLRAGPWLLPAAALPQEEEGELAQRDLRLIGAARRKREAATESWLDASVCRLTAWA